MQQIQLRRIGLFLGEWVLIAFSFSGFFYFFSILFNPDRTLYWKDIFIWQIFIYAWAILFPLINLFAKQFRFNQKNWWKIIPIHVVAMTVFVLLHTFIYILARKSIGLEHFINVISFGDLAAKPFIRNLALGGIIYCLILSSIYTIDFYRRFPKKLQLLKKHAFSILNTILAVVYDDIKPLDQTNIHSTNYILIAIMLLVPLGLGLLSINLGQDINWDLQNYHIYNPYAYLYGRINYDLAPAGIQTYFNPFIDVLYYQAIVSWNPKLVGFVLGFFQGLNFILLYGIYRSVFKPFRLAARSSLFLALTGILTVGFLSEIGTTFHDSLTAIFSLSALLIIIHYISNIYNNNQKAVLAVLAAGLIIGLGSGLKLVTAIFALAMCFSFFVLPLSWVRRLKFSIIFGSSVVVGLLISGGYWFYLIWYNFGNPTFPHFNHVFGGDLAIIEPIRDERFLPKSFFEKVFYPVIFTLSPTRVSEIGYKQLNWLILYISLFTFFGTRLLSIFKSNSSISRLTLEAKFVITYFCLAYVLWLNVFGVYRYLISIEVLIPLLLFVVAIYLFESKLLCLIAVIFIAVLTMVNLLGVPNWGRASWATQVFHVEADSLQKTEPAAIFLGSQPMAWLVPALKPVAPVIQIAPNFPISNIYWQRAESLARTRSGKLYIILELQDQGTIDAANKGLSNINLSVNTNSCVLFDAYLGNKNFKYTYCEVDKK